MSRLACLTLFSITTLLTGASAFAEDCPDCDVVRDFTAVSSSIKEDLSSPTQCTSIAPTLDSCSFSAFCSKLSPNAEAPYLYINSQGEKIPNFALKGAEDELAACFNQKTAKTPAEKADITKNNVKQKQQQTVRAEKTFYDAIEKNGEQSKWFEISHASIKIAMDNLAQGRSKNFKIEFFPPFTRDQIEDNLNTLENAAGQKLSPESRKAFVEMKFTQLDEGSLPAVDKTWEALNKNPFLNADLFVNSSAAGAGSKAQVLKNQAEYQAQLDRIDSIFKSTQQYILKYLEEKRTPANSALMDLFKRRIETIRLQAADPTTPAGACPAPNAFYFPKDHSFHICPQVMQLPTESLRWLIAHELGHAIDPCNASSDLMSVQGERIHTDHRTDAEIQAVENEIKTQKQKTGIYPMSIRDPEKPGNVGFYVNEDDFDKRDMSQEYKNPRLNLVSAGVLAQNHPFGSTIQCIQDATAIGARGTPKPEVLARTLEVEIQKLKQEGADEKNSAALARILSVKKHLPDFLARHGACTTVVTQEGHSQLQEVMADKIAEEVLAREVRSQPEANRARSLFEATGFFLAIECPQVSAKIAHQKEALLTKYHCGTRSSEDRLTISQVNQSRSLDEDAHPYSVDRFDRFFLVHPEIRKELGCKNTPEAKYCP